MNTTPRRIRAGIELSAEENAPAAAEIVNRAHLIHDRPINAMILVQHLPDAQLVMYPDASHGAQSQHAGSFLEHARMFLNG